MENPDDSSLKLRIEKAMPADAPELSAIAWEAKGSWGYPASWMAAWKSLLIVSPDYLAAHPSFVGTDNGKITGFAVVKVTGKTASLEHLWVRPAEMRRGIGRMLFQRCEQAAATSGAQVLEIESDPHAELFYLRMGAKRVGEVPANIEGIKRSLPLLQKQLKS